MGASTEPNQRHNQATMHGLSYYLLIPRTRVTGKLFPEGVTTSSRRVEGTAWMERQWGNYRVTDQYQGCWHWVGFKTPDGEGVSMQRFFIPNHEEGNDKEGNEKETVEFNSRVHTFDASGLVAYGNSSAFTISNRRWYKSPSSDKYILVEFDLAVGKRVYHIKAISDGYDTSFPTLKSGPKPAPMWTGPVTATWEEGGKKRVARGFMEYYLPEPGGDVDARHEKPSAPRHLETGMWVR
jgi:predicted secreted hydrolase